MILELSFLYIRAKYRLLIMSVYPTTIRLNAHVLDREVHSRAWNLRAISLDILPPLYVLKLHSCWRIMCSTPPPQWTDYACSFIESDMSWRIPLFIQCIIGSILAAGSILIPESPRYELISIRFHHLYSAPRSDFLTLPDGL